MARLGPLPSFPRWTGMQAHVTGPHRGPDGHLVATVSVRPTRRARLWARWRMLTGRWNTDASAHR